jgi:hypothetical protein
MIRGMKDLRAHLRDLYQVEHAHPLFDRAAADMPAPLRGKRPDNFPHSVWELVEHIRISQWDILEYVLDPKHVSPEWPGGYWPKSAAPADDAAWESSVSAVRADLQRFVDIVNDESNDLLAPVSFANNATFLRQILMNADHNAYHIAQIVTVRRLLGAWKS